ncbi:helix-turn-helix domain-containing protein [Streptomyces sp. NPDC006430]|uniref:helix-turn-helix domain-containing protein n=1 Tax=Streptomyces sp. NPDC006430 TaxID=3154299 RepID=UPI0033BAB450
MTGLDGQHASPNKQLGSALRALQQKSGRTLRSLESEVLISDSSLSRYLRGSTVPPWATVRDLCRALGADPSEYRALWEAADRCQPKVFVSADPATAPAPTADPTADPTAGPTGDPTAAPATGTQSWWRRPRGPRRMPGLLVQRRWAWAVSGVCVGLLLGGMVVRFVLPSSGAPAPVRGTPDAQAPRRAVAQGAARLQDVTRIFVNRVTGNCLDHSLDKGLRTFEPNGLSYQRWTVHPYPDGTSELRNHATGACLDSSASGLRGVSCTRAPSQKWAVTAWTDASVEIKSRASGACLDDGEAGLRAVPCDGSDHQKWG